MRPALLVALCVFALVGWQGITTVGRLGGDDAGEHVAYAQYLDAHARIPSKSENYEYATPPLFHLLAIGAEHAVHRVPSRAVELPWNAASRVLWLALAAGGALALGKRRRLGVALLVLAGVWALDEALSLGRSLAWSSGQLLVAGLRGGLIATTALIAREVWPESRGRWLAAGGFAAAYPVVYRMSILFHPEMPFALLCALATLVVLQARRRAWPARLGLAARRSARCSGADPPAGRAGDRVPGRRDALAGAPPRAAAPAARGRRDRARSRGPGGATPRNRWGNPLQSNLEPRASLMLDRQPASFFVSLPLRTLVVHPFRPDFSDDLLPKLHAELWSDWFGYLHGGWAAPTRLERVTASTPERARLRRRRARGRPGSLALALPALARALRRQEANTPPRRPRAARRRLLRGVRRHADPVPAALRRPDQVELPALHHALLGGLLRRGMELRCGRGATASTSRSSRSPPSTS